jgi:small subunit ribosomal protein S19
MSRSSWKNPFVKLNCLKVLTTSKKSNIYSISRNSEIIPKFFGLTFKVHNGRQYTEILVTKNMIGHKFGEFTFTRIGHLFKKRKIVKK